MNTHRVAAMLLDVLGVFALVAGLMVLGVLDGVYWASALLGLFFVSIAVSMLARASALYDRAREEAGMSAAEKWALRARARKDGEA